MKAVHPAKVNLAILTPVFMALSGLLVAAAAKYGVHLDQTGVALALTAGATGAGAVGVKLIHDVKLSPEVVTDVEVAEQAAAAADPSLAAELAGAWDFPTAPAKQGLPS